MLNRVTLLGRVASDIELKTTATGVSVTSFALAVGRSYAKAGTERQTDFIDIVVWRNTAEFVAKYFKKGQMMAVDGSLQTRMYEDREGKKRKVVEVVAENIYFAESKSNSGGNGSAPTFSVPDSTPVFESGSVSDFEEILSSDDDELPF